MTDPHRSTLPAVDALVEAARRAVVDRAASAVDRRWHPQGWWLDR